MYQQKKKKPRKKWNELRRRVCLYAFLWKPMKYMEDGNGKQKVSLILTVGTRSKQSAASCSVRLCLFGVVHDDSSVFQLWTIEARADEARKEKVCVCVTQCTILTYRTVRWPNARIRSKQTKEDYYFEFASVFFWLSRENPLIWSFVCIARC